MHLQAVSTGKSSSSKRPESERLSRNRRPGRTLLPESDSGRMVVLQKSDRSKTQSVSWSADRRLASMLSNILGIRRILSCYPSKTRHDPCRKFIPSDCTGNCNIIATCGGKVAISPLPQRANFRRYPASKSQEHPGTIALFPVMTAIWTARTGVPSSSVRDPMRMNFAGPHKFP